MSDMMTFSRADFPSDFSFGVATSAYQIEGSKFGECGPSHWDSFAATPGNTVRSENGSIACDHYHQYEKDLDLIRDANLDHYRFSVSWARILPDGKNINQQGLDFYDRLTDGMLQRGLKPMLTLHHWDMPSALSDIGGWRNRDITERFADFTDHVVQCIGDRMWASGTFNEPWCVTWLSHFHGNHAPGMRDIRATSRAIHHLLVSHGKSIDVMRSHTMDNLGIYLNFEPAEPASEKPQDVAASNRYHAYYNKCFLEPLLEGTYPQEIMEAVEQHLPKHWEDDMKAIGTPIDWLGINNYTRKIIADDKSNVWPAMKEVEGPLAKTNMGWEIAPNRFEWLLNWVASKTNGLPLYITENGMAGHEQKQGENVNDPWRIDFLNQYVTAMKKAMTSGANIKGYTVWSLLDNYEWSFGYDKRFGIIHVDYNTLERTPKQSWHALKNALKV